MVCDYQLFDSIENNRNRVSKLGHKSKKMSFSPTIKSMGKTEVNLLACGDFSCIWLQNFQEQ